MGARWQQLGDCSIGAVPKLTSACKAIGLTLVPGSEIVVNSTLHLLAVMLVH